MRLLPAAIVLAGVSGVLGAVQKVTRAGRYLYTADGNRFYIKGIAYQEQGETAVDPQTGFVEPISFIDPLADAAACTRDVPILQAAGVNAIRVYSVDSSKNHDSCMTTLSAAGIYTIIDVSLPINGSIDRAFPSWSTNLLDLYIGTIDVFSKYDNVLAYNIGNEVVTSPNETAVAPFLKAASRDIKAYLKSKNINSLVGYAAVDGDAAWRVPLSTFLECSIPDGSDASSIDLFGLNSYRWCGDDSFDSAYARITADYANFGVPAYFSEFGCITSPPRLWTEVPALLGPQMSPVWSGGVAFSYFPAESGQGQFGMVTITGDGQVQKSDDFNRLQTQYTTVSPPNTPSQSNSAASNIPCPPPSPSFLGVTQLPPTPNDAACECLKSQFSCLFTPKTPNVSDIVGPLINLGCELLGGQGGTCDPISSSGSAGRYGSIAACDPSTKASYVFSSFYELTNRNPQSCDFGGNATVNNMAPTSVASLNSAANSCLASATGTSVPTSRGTSPASNNGASNAPQPSANAGVGIYSTQSLLGLTFAFVAALAGGLWTFSI